MNPKSVADAQTTCAQLLSNGLHSPGRFRKRRRRLDKYWADRKRATELVDDDRSADDVHYACQMNNTRLEAFREEVDASTARLLCCSVAPL